jgi:hypothetical protein
MHRAANFAHKLVVIHWENSERRIYGENNPLASKFILSEEAVDFLGDLAASSDPQVTT